MNKIAVYGASGRTGKLFTELALKNGHGVKALVRTSSKLELQHPSLEVIQGDVSDPVKVAETIKATDAVIDLINPGKGSPPDLLQIATQNILNAMQQNNVKRLIMLASLPFGATDERDKPSFYYKFAVFVSNTLLGPMVEKGRARLDLIKRSELDWTVVRAPTLVNQPPHGRYRVGCLDAHTGKSVARADVAAFLFNELKSPQYIRQMPSISN